ncbi:MAG: DNA-binding domain-containing protein [Mesorhizobium sp.]
MVAITQSKFAAALFGPETMPPGLTTARGEADASRFAVYRNNVSVALIKALEGRFPVTRRIVGDVFFRAMAHAFIAENKPKSPLIFEYGDALPSFIEKFEPASGLPYLADVARLEAAWTDAYHAAEASVLEVSDLGAMRQPMQCRFITHPSSVLVKCGHPAGTIWAVNQLAEVPPISISEPETILIVRPFAEVRVQILPPQDALFAERLFAGFNLGDAGQEALSRNDQFDFGTALVGLIALGAFTKIEGERKI